MNNSEFPIILFQNKLAHSLEQLGTKQKFWVSSEKEGVRDRLYKIGRPGSGENWSEKVACELCEQLGIPHAHYDFAAWRNTQGVISENFVPERGRLVHGNEMLIKAIPDYNADKKFKQKNHTVRAITAILKNVALPLGFTDTGNFKNGLDVFSGYLLLDAWIANQDRHHENWGVVVSEKMNVHLAPSFDHASSLGRNETDNARRDRLTTNDIRRSMDQYILKARSAIYKTNTSNKPLSTIGAFIEIAKHCRKASLLWKKRLFSVKHNHIIDVFDRIPDNFISKVESDFALKMLELNRKRIIALKEI